MASALEKIRVVDFGQYIAGPLAAMLLADYGADVVHVDPPGGPRWSHPADAYYNRSKTRVTLDLKDARGREAAHELLAGADVVIENFRPGVMDRLGFGAEAVTKRLHRLVYCSLPGFPPSDSRAQMPGWEGVVQAATAGYRTLADHYYTDPTRYIVDDPERPLFTALPVASTLAGMLGATCIVMALIARERTDLGQRIEVPLSEAMVEMLAISMIHPQFGRTAPPGVPLGLFQCADGRFIDWMAAPFRVVLWLLDALGLTQSWHEEGLLDYAGLVGNQDLADRLDRKLRSLFASQPAAAWEELAIRLRLPLTLVRSPEEWLSLEHALASESVIDVHDPRLGPVRMTGLAVNLSETPGRVRPRQAPHPVRTARGPAWHEESGSKVEILPETISQPLQGISVVDLTTVIAGPTVGRILSDFGATVIKVNHPATTYLTPNYINRGKRTMFLDIQQPLGKEVLTKLIARADVLLENFAMGAADRYGVGYAEARAIRPGIIYGSVSTFARTGPFGPRRGYEMQGQASTGLMIRYGGTGWPLNQPVLVNDVGTGVLGAFGIALALLHYARTGEPQEVGVSLSQTASTHEAAYLLSYPGHVGDEPSGLHVRGWSALQRLYHARDRWFFLGATLSQVATLERIAGVELLHAESGIDLAAEGTLARALEETFLREPCATWVARLRAAGIGAHVVLTHLEAAASSAFLERGVVRRTAEEDAETYTPSIGPWLSATPPNVGPSDAIFGADTARQLDSLGFADRVEELIKLGITMLP